MTKPLVAAESLLAIGATERRLEAYANYDIMLGALAQFDKAGEAGTSEAPSLQANGWMAGPYVSARLGAGFVLDGRAAWGRADESLGADLRHSGARQLLQARLRGNRQIEGWTFAPSLAVRYFEEATAATPE